MFLVRFGITSKSGWTLTVEVYQDQWMKAEWINTSAWLSLKIGCFGPIDRNWSIRLKRQAALKKSLPLFYAMTNCYVIVNRFTAAAPKSKNAASFEEIRSVSSTKVMIIHEAKSLQASVKEKPQVKAVSGKRLNPQLPHYATGGHN